MNEKFSDDLLSAFFDGELSQAERAEVEQRLAASKPAKQELDHIEQMSALLGKLPRQNAPQEFRAQVMQRIEREMLLPSTDELQQARRTTPKTPKHSRTRRWQVVSTLAACLVVVVVTVLLVDQPDDRQDDGQRMEVAGNPKQDADRPIGSVSNEAERVVSSDLRENAGSAESKSFVASADDASRMESGPAFPKTARLRVSKSMAETVPSSVAKARSRKVADKNDGRKVEGKSVARSQKGGSGKPLLKSPKSRQSQLVFSDNLKKAQPGQIVEALEGPPGRVAVVRLTVVDRQAGLKYLQVLLQRHEIPVQAPVAQSKTGDENSDLSVAAATANQLECVFVEATDRQLMAAFQQMKNDAAIMVLDVDETSIAVASLDHYLPPANLRKSVRLPSAPKPLSVPADATDHTPASERGSSVADKKATESIARKKTRRYKLKSKKEPSTAPAPGKKNLNQRIAKDAPSSGSGPLVNSRQLAISLPADILPDGPKSKTKSSAVNKFAVKKREPVRKLDHARSTRSGLRSQAHSSQKRSARGVKTLDSAKPFLILFVLTLDESKAGGKASAPASIDVPSSRKLRKARPRKDG